MSSYGAGKSVTEDLQSRAKTVQDLCRRLFPIFLARTSIAVAYILLLNSVVGRCPIYAATGIPCPACGMTRAYGHLLCGEWSAAWIAHPLWWLAPPLWLLICLEDKHLGRRWSGIRRHALISIALIFWGRWLLTMIS